MINVVTIQHAHCFSTHTEAKITLRLFYYSKPNVPNMHVLMVGGSSRRHGGNMQIPHRKVLSQMGIEPRTFLL